MSDVPLYTPEASNLDQGPKTQNAHSGTPKSLDPEHSTPQG